MAPSPQKEFVHLMNIVASEAKFTGDEAYLAEHREYAHSLGFSTRLPRDIGPVAITAGGPSLRQSLGHLSRIKFPIIACNGTHDYLIENGIIPWACLIMDINEESWRILRQAKNAQNLRPQTPVKYLISSQCHPRLFDELHRIDCDVRVWDVMGEVDGTQAPICSREEGGRFYAALGSTVALQAMIMAYNMGSRFMDIYGMDSCLLGNAHHAYRYEPEVEEATEVAYRSEVIFGEDKDIDRVAELETLPDGHEVIADPIICGGKSFRCEPSMLLQAQDFQKIIRVIGTSAKIRVHGPGLIAQIMKEGERIAAGKLKHVPEGLK